MGLTESNSRRQSIQIKSVIRRTGDIGKGEYLVIEASSGCLK